MMDPKFGYLKNLYITPDPRQLVAVLGCGPTGMMVAHAVAMSGRTPVIYAPRKPSRIGGAQYLHMSIPGLTSERHDGIVTFQKRGTPDEYARKVYGDPRMATSWYTYPEGPYRIWNLQAAYAKAWATYQEQIVDLLLDQEEIAGLVDMFPEVFSTIPAKALCRKRDEHSFESQEVWITEQSFCSPNHILYSGDKKDSWYRTSRIFGTPGCEWPMDPRNGLEAVRVTKPLKTNCDCFPSVVRFGRYGRWEKSQLTHHAYWQATDALTEGGATP